VIEEDDPIEEVLVWALYEHRKERWIRDNPGAYPSEYESAMAVLREELGL
jgi:hypothetical protein